MGKTITITEDEFRKLTVQATKEIMDKHGGDAPQATLLFSLACVMFSALLASRLFLEDEDSE